MDRSLNDVPIKNSTEDLLGRVEFANSIARYLQRVDASEGVVVGVLGPWGVGKTSLLNLIEESLMSEPKIDVFKFNPWLFSESDQLVAAFFGELAAQVRIDEEEGGKLADALQNYGESLSILRLLPVAGPTIGRFLELSRWLGQRLKKNPPALTERRDGLRDVLAGLERPLVVVLDDIDRLGDDEIRQIFKLVRLTGSFPNLIYLVAFDRTRVEAALGGSDSGRRYLEKVVQVHFDVPAIPLIDLRRILFSALDDAIGTVDGTGAFDEQRWPDVFAECIWPLVHNLRDVKRFCAGLTISLSSLGEDVALVDALAMEAMRVFLPDTHARLAPTLEALTDTSQAMQYGGDQSPERAERIGQFVDSAGDQRRVAEDIVRRLFPAAARHVGGTNYGSDWLRTWQRERRVAHPVVLQFYLERIVSPEVLTIRRVETVFRLLTQPDELREVLDDLDSRELEAAIAGLEAYEDEYPLEAVVPASVVLLQMFPRLRTTRQGVFDFGPDLAVTRVVLRLLQRLDGEEAVAAAVNDILDQITTTYGAFDVVRMVGHEENVGHRMVSQEDAAQLEERLTEMLLDQPAEELSSEREILSMVYWLLSRDPTVRERWAALKTNVVRQKLLADSFSQRHSQEIGSRAVRSVHLLSWDALQLVFGSSEEVASAVAELEESLNKDDADGKALVALARKYLAGWRPEAERGNGWRPDEEPTEPESRPEDEPAGSGA